MSRSIPAESEVIARKGVLPTGAICDYCRDAADSKGFCACRRRLVRMLESPAELAKRARIRAALETAIDNFDRVEARPPTEALGICGVQMKGGELCHLPDGHRQDLAHQPRSAVSCHCGLELLDLKHPTEPVERVIDECRTEVHRRAQCIVEKKAHRDSIGGEWLTIKRVGETWVPAWLSELGPRAKKALIEKLERQLDSALKNMEPVPYELPRESPPTTPKFVLARGDKHGPGGSGLRGPCDPDCAKCAREKPDRALVAGELPIRCACCHVRAPDAPNVAARDLTGWALFAYPLANGMSYPGVQVIGAEHQRFCPRCAEKVAKFIDHLSTPMLDEEDLL